MSVRYESRMSDGDALLWNNGYDGSACFAVNSDPAAVPDADFYSECLRTGVEEVLSVA